MCVKCVERKKKRSKKIQKGEKRKREKRNLRLVGKKTFGRTNRSGWESVSVFCWLQCDMKEEKGDGRKWEFEEITRVRERQVKSDPPGLNIHSYLNHLPQKHSESDLQKYAVGLVCVLMQIQGSAVSCSIWVSWPAAVVMVGWFDALLKLKRMFVDRLTFHPLNLLQIQGNWQNFML